MHEAGGRPPRGSPRGEFSASEPAPPVLLRDRPLQPLGARCAGSWGSRALCSIGGESAYGIDRACPTSAGAPWSPGAGAHRAHHLSRRFAIRLLGRGSAAGSGSPPDQRAQCRLRRDLEALARLVLDFGRRGGAPGLLALIERAAARGEADARALAALAHTCSWMATSRKTMVA